MLTAVGRSAQHHCLGKLRHAHSPDMHVPSRHKLHLASCMVYIKAKLNGLWACSASL